MAGDDQATVQKKELPSQSQLALAEMQREEPRISVFMNLRSLEIIHCNTLKSLFPVSISIHLEQLDFLKLYDCSEMVHVLEPKAEGALTAVKLPKLKCLVLKHLHLLQSFCGDYNFEGPELELVRVKDLPRMEKFSQGNTVTPKLKAVHVRYVEKCWRGGLNQTLQYIHERQA